MIPKPRNEYKKGVRTFTMDTFVSLVDSVDACEFNSSLLLLNLSRQDIQNLLSGKVITAPLNYDGEDAFAIKLSMEE